MAQLFTLMYGKSKKRMKPIMIDKLSKCHNYRDARSCMAGWHDIVPAEIGAVVWRQKSATVGGNRNPKCKQWPRCSCVIQGKQSDCQIK